MTKHLSNVFHVHGKESCKPGSFEDLGSVLLTPSSFSREKTSLGLNLVKPRPEAGPRAPGIWFARRLCIVYRALHMSRHASNTSSIAYTHAPFIAILCLTVKRVPGIASPRGHRLQKPQTGQSCSTTTGQSSQCPLLREEKKLPLQKGRQARTKESTPPTMPVHVPRSEGKPQAHLPGRIFRFGLFSGILFAKLLLSFQGFKVSKNEQSALLS